MGFWNNGLFCWSTRKQVCVSLSAAEAEFVALSERCSDIQGTINFLSELIVSINMPSLMQVDHTVAITWAAISLGIVKQNILRFGSSLLKT